MPKGKKYLLIAKLFTLAIFQHFRFTSSYYSYIRYFFDSFRKTDSNKKNTNNLYTDQARNMRAFFSSTRVSKKKTRQI